MSKADVRLLLVDDHHVVRLGLRSLLETVPHFAVVGEAGSVEEAVTEARRCRPNVVLMDVRLPDGSGVEACREICSESRGTRVLMLTAYADEDVLIASILAGASGYLLKQTPVDRLMEAIEVVAQGGSLLDPAVTTAVLERIRRPSGHTTDDPLAALSEQERKVLLLIAAGKTNREIAAAIYLSEHTVRTYVSNILRKLHMPRRVQAAAF